MTQVTIIIHEGRGGRGPAGRMGRRHGHPGGAEEQTEGPGHHHGVGCGHRHETRQRPFGRHGHRRHGHRRHDHRRYGDPESRPAPGSAADEQRQLARRLRHQMRHLMQEAEAAGLSPERVERIIRREGQRSYL